MAVFAKSLQQLADAGQKNLLMHVILLIFLCAVDDAEVAIINGEVMAKTYRGKFQFYQYGIRVCQVEDTTSTDSNDAINGVASSSSSSISSNDDNNVSDLSNGGNPSPAHVGTAATIPSTAVNAIN